MDINSTDRNETDEHLAGDAAIAKVRALLPSFSAAMFVTKGVGGADLHMRPLALAGDPSVFGGTLWFLTDGRSRKIREMEQDPRVSLLFQNDRDGCYLQLDGTAAVVSDRAKIRELYTPIQRAWFPGGVDDPYLTLVRFDATNGSFWDDAGGVLRVLAAFTKSVVTGTPGKSARTGTMDI